MIECPPCHCLYDEFLCLFPQFSCKGADALCCALKAAECFVRGFYDRCLRDQALLYVTAHIIEANGVAITEGASRLSGVAKSVLSRPGGSTPQASAWFSLSVYGLAYMAMVERDPDLAMLVI